MSVHFCECVRRTHTSTCYTHRGEESIWKLCSKDKAGVHQLFILKLHKQGYTFCIVVTLGKDTPNPRKYSPYIYHGSWIFTENLSFFAF